MEAERDARTVFAQNLPIRATEEDIIDFFTKAGKVRDVRLISDRNSRKSKG
jgi:RNA-binding protein 39